MVTRNHGFLAGPGSGSERTMLAEEVRVSASHVDVVLTHVNEDLDVCVEPVEESSRRGMASGVVGPSAFSACSAVRSLAPPHRRGWLG